jgi:hypothetical protein
MSNTKILVIMKKIISIMFAALFLMSGVTYGQTAKETIKERKAIARYARSELNQRASKDARKESRTLAKEGWKVAPGQLPLEKQLDRSYLMYYEYDEDSNPKYIFGGATSVGATYDAAKVQATDLAKVDLAGKIQTEVTALVESTVGNKQISQSEAYSIAQTVQSSKNLIAQTIGRTLTVTECYREGKKNKTVEVRVTLAYNAQNAMNAAKAVIESQLEAKGEDLHNQLDAIWANSGL